MLPVIEHFAKSLNVTQSHLKWRPCVSLYYYFAVTITVCLSYNFWDFSASNNGVTLKSRLEVTQGDSKWYYSKAFYMRSFVTIAMSCIISEIKQDTGRNRIFFIPIHSTPPLAGSLSEYCHTVWYRKQELSYRQQIASKLRTRYAQGIYRHKYYTVTLKSRLSVTQETEPLDRSYTT